MRVQPLARVGDKWSVFVAYGRDPRRFIHGTGDTKEEALLALCEALCDEAGITEHVYEAAE